MKKFVGYLRLMRIPNIVTSISDVLAGIAIAASMIRYPKVSVADLIQPGVLLIISTAALYGGGVVLNDVFDAELDKTERPERAIPSGLIKKSSAAVFGMLLLIIGIVAAALSHPDNLFSQSFFLAITIAVAAIVYDKWMKHHPVAGPLTMGFCRGCNLLLGMSIVVNSLHSYWFLAIVPVIYIAAITMISRGEVHGSRRNTLYLAAFFYIMVICAILYYAFMNITLDKTLPFLVVFSLMIFLPLQKAILKPEGPRIGKAVKAGVIALIAMNASWAAASGEIYFALMIIVLLPISLLLARAFAVT